jgi:hypothetical protein
MDNKQIETIIVDVLTNYGNPAYLRKTKLTSFEEAMGTRLWKLWYGDYKKPEDLSVSTMQDEYKKCKRNVMALQEYESKLLLLRKSLVEEFDLLKRQEINEITSCKVGIVGFIKLYINRWIS